LPQALAEIVVAAANGAGKPVPTALAQIEPGAAAQVIAASLLSGKHKAILLGNYAEQHQEASQLFAMAQALAGIVGAKLGCLGEAANSVGGYAADASPQTEDGLNAQSMFAQARKAYVLLGVEPEFDCANPVRALAALEAADLVVVMSPFRHGTHYADAILPIGPFTETAGSFVNCEGRLQSFNGVVKPFGETRARVEGLACPGVDARTSGIQFRVDRRRPLVAAYGRRHYRRTSRTTPTSRSKSRLPDPQESSARRRSHPFRRPARAPGAVAAATADSKPPHARMNELTLAQVGVNAGEQVKVRQNGGEAVLTAVLDATVPAGVARIAAAHPSTCGLGGLSGPITVERV
jgi:NADH-quinone oxidoreductase subunit G